MSRAHSRRGRRKARSSAPGSGSKPTSRQRRAKARRQRRGARPMRISSYTWLIVALAAASPAAAQQGPTVRGAVRDVAQPRLDQAQQQRPQVPPDSMKPPVPQPPPPAQVLEAPTPAPMPADTTTLLPTATVLRPGEPVLVFEREVFTYSGRSRRDPFHPLTGDE